MATSELERCGGRESFRTLCYRERVDEASSEKMRYSTTPHFDREFEKFSREVQHAFKKQIAFLLRDFRHPSLRTKKYGGTVDVWQARVTDTVRFYFQITGDTYRLLNIRKHPK